MKGSIFSKENIARFVSSFQLVKPIFKRYGKRLLFGFLALGSVNLCQLYIPRIIKHAVDSLEKGTATQANLFYYTLIIIGLALSVAGFRFIWRYLILGFSRLLERDLRNDMFAHLLTLDRFFFQKRPAGELMALATNDLAAVQLASGMGLVAFADAMLMTMATIAFMAYINPMLTLIAVLPMPLLALLTSFLSARLHKRFKKVQEQFSHLTEFSRTSLASIRLIKAYTLEPSQTEHFNKMGKSYVRNNLRLAMIQGTLFPISGLLANVGMWLVLFFGGRLTINNAISIGDFVAFISYLYMLTWPTMALGWVANLFQRGVTSLDRLQGIFRAQALLKDPPDPQPLTTFSGNIRLEHLEFRYPEQKTGGLQDVNLSIKPGVLGVVGKTGSGKTTFCQVLARFYPVEDNTVYFGDQDVNHLSLESVRSKIAYIPQDVVLFADTIASNIAFGAKDASQEEIEAAARAAVIHDEIMAMPAGYQTRIGEKGVTISGGQRQRLALARALLLDRPVLIIDDGLSAVDMQTEYAIIKSISDYMKGRTCIIVSHRVAPLADAHEIIVFDKGKLVAQGDHRTLFATNAYYRKIYEYQMHTKECAEQPVELPS